MTEDYSVPDFKEQLLEAMEKMNKLLPIKRTYRVEFSPEVKTYIEGASKDEFILGWHDLLDHAHIDDKFMYLDFASGKYIEECKSYQKKFASLLERTKTKIAKEKNTSLTEIKKEIKSYKEKLKEEKKYRAWRKKNNMPKKYENMSNIEETQNKITELYNLIEEINNIAFAFTEKKLGDGPCRLTYWKPVFERMYWSFDYISVDIPSWISNRNYVVLKEKLPNQPKVTKLKRIEPKGSGVNWKSRNRGGKPKLSSGHFNRRAVKDL